jgi:glycerophosphoryl diester phosphodiesterase
MQQTNILITPPVIAHRGRSAVAPENTMIAFLKAKESGLRWLEFDVTLAACGEVVIMHDDELQRTTNGVGNIADFTYGYLKTLDAGSWFSPQFAGEKIPTLKDVLLFVNQYQLAANIEIKSNAGKEEWVVKRVLEEVEKYANPNTPLLLTSFSKAIIEQVRYQNNQIPLGFLMSDWDETYHRFCDELSIINVGIDHYLLSYDRVKQLKSVVSVVSAFTVNDVARAKALFSFGVDAIFSDCSQVFLSGVAEVLR